MVAWSSFTSNHDNSCNELVFSLVGWSVQDGQISIDDVEDVHHLSLVLMYSLNLDIIHSVNWDDITGLLFNPFGEGNFVCGFDFDELVNESLVSGVWFELSQVVESSDPLIDTSESVTDELRKFWVAAVDPSSWGNTVGLVLKFTWIKLIEFLEECSLKEM
jgi:hypothetical protein